MTKEDISFVDSILKEIALYLPTRTQAPYLGMRQGLLDDFEKVKKMVHKQAGLVER